MDDVGGNARCRVHLALAGRRFGYRQREPRDRRQPERQAGGRGHRFHRRILPRFFHHSLNDASRSILTPLRGSHIQDGHGQSIHLDTGFMSRFGNGVAHEHGRHDEKARRDGDLPAQQHALPARSRGGHAGSSLGENAAHVKAARQLKRRLETGHQQRQHQ